MVDPLVGSIVVCGIIRILRITNGTNKVEVSVTNKVSGNLIGLFKGQSASRVLFTGQSS